MDESVFNNEERLNELIYETQSISAFLDCLDAFATHFIRTVNTDSIVADIMDKKFIHEVTTFGHSQVSLYFGKTMKDLKCVIADKKCREHEMWLRYVGPKILRISNLSLPPSSIQERTYKSLEEVINVFIKHVDELSNYFEQIDLIKTHCTVMEPLKPTYKEDYRKIYIADRIWLHLEVYPNGSMKNLNIIKPLEQDHNKLQNLLLNWDFNIDIAENVVTIIASFLRNMHSDELVETKQAGKLPDCIICCSVELLNNNHVPLPLCTCGAYYHRNCLFEWFVICMGVRTPSFRVARGPCPSCTTFICCNGKD